MRFNRFPLDEHSCKFEVGSTSLDDTRMLFNNHKLDYDPAAGNTILDYKVDISALKLEDRTLQYVDSNYSLCGFEMKLVRNSAKYVNLSNEILFSVIWLCCIGLETLQPKPNLTILTEPK